MSKYDAGQLNFAALCIDGKKIAADHGGLVAELDGAVVADMLREYAAHLAAQAEWPSEEDVRKALSEWYEWNGEDHSDDAQHDVAMRAALQSVRPPAGVVSDEDVNVAYKAAMKIAGESRPWLARSYFRAALESYASRHATTAPTKD